MQAGHRLGWRLCHRPFADLTGDGARLYGGRWNSPGWSLLYMASIPGLCVLEMRDHLDLPFSLIPDDYVLMTLDLSGLEVERVPDTVADPISAGDRWLAEGRTPVLEVASVILDEATNLLLNPAHPGAEGAKSISVRDFSFDHRLWSGT